MSFPLPPALRSCLCLPLSAPVLSDREETEIGVGVVAGSWIRPWPLRLEDKSVVGRRVSVWSQLTYVAQSPSRCSAPYLLVRWVP